MSPLQEITNEVSSKLPLKTKLSPMRWVQRILIGILTLQIFTALLLLIITAFGRRRKHDKSFPHLELEEVQVGENKLLLYSYGGSLYEDMLTAIDSAQEDIYIESYIWKDDAVGLEFQARLARKAREGVAVYVIFDSFGNLVVPQAFKSSFDPAIHLLKYRTIRRPWHIFDPRRYALDHRKLLIVDGKIGFIGGYNIGQLYTKEWRDTHLRLRGPIATELAQSFVSFWNRYCPENDKITHRYHHNFDSLITISQNDAIRMIFPIRDMYIAAIDKAEKFILLTNAYFVPDHILLEALKQAAARGVDVRILLPWESNHILTDWISHSYFSECLQAGIRIFGYRFTMLHAKTCTIDGQWSTIGTANLDRLSSLGNYEINVEVYSPELAQQMQVLFDCDTSDIFELTSERWNNRPWYVKLSERILAPWRFMM